MFTGIIEAIGEVAARRTDAAGAVLRIRWSGWEWRPTLGESIAVDGACLSVTRSGRGWFEADCSPQTLRLTTLGRLRPGGRVNLERSLAADGRLGGHFVQGHVDAVGEVVAVRREGKSRVMAFSRPQDVSAYLVARGSVAVNGVSLTVSGLGPDRFEVTLVPHTREVTNLSRLRVGSRVNLEADILGKYVRRFLESGVGPVP